MITKKNASSSKNLSKQNTPTENNVIFLGFLTLQNRRKLCVDKNKKFDDQIKNWERLWYVKVSNLVRFECV